MQSTVLSRRYYITLAAVAVAFALTALLERIAPERNLSLIFFFAAISVSSGAGGMWTGILATVLSFAIYDYFFLVPYRSFIIRSHDIPLMVMFALVALFINGLSERLRAATRAADRRFHDLVQGLDVIVWEGNPRNLAYTFVSDRAEDILGYPTERWLQDSEFRDKIVFDADNQYVMNFLQTALKSGGDHEIEYRVLDSDGRRHWLRETVHVSRGDDGSAAILSGLCVDITERKNAAEELADVKDELAALNGITAAVSASLEMSELVATLRRRLVDQFGIDAGALLLYNEKEGQYQLDQSWGLNPAQTDEIDVQVAALLESDRAREAEPEPVSESADLSRNGHLTMAPSSEPALNERKLLLNDSWSDTWADSIVAPLVANGEIEGAMCLLTRSEVGFSPARKAFFNSVGMQVGVLVQNARLYEQVRAGRENLHRLSRQLVRIQEGERRAIARELHDEIGQVLTGLKLSMEMALRLPRESAGAKLREALTLVNELMTHVDALSLDLRPAMLDDFGLVPTLLWHFERYTSTTGVKVYFEHTGIDVRFSQELETTAYRIVQEALTNSARHAATPEVTVRLWAAHGVLGIQIRDTGRGFDPAKLSVEDSSGGLAGMRERATLVNGYVTLETAPGEGVCLTAELPLQPDDISVERTTAERRE